MFDDRFEVFLCDTDFGKSINKQIRYRVFCLERGFEDPALFPTGEESDHWDQHSIHFIVREKKTGRWVASTRLIAPYGDSLPVEQMNSLSPGFLTGINRKNIGEISRFCVIKQNASTSSQFANVTRPQLDWIGAIEGSAQFEVTWGMLRAVSYYGIEHGIDYSYMLITRPFSRLLNRLGIILYQSGIMKEHRGMRAPFLVDFRESIPSVSNKSSHVRELFQRRHLSWQPVSGLEHEYLERMQEQLEDCSECRMN
jgi:N-acyl amino acid synthase of PEP-CTERM/exosortase system